MALNDAWDFDPTTYASNTDVNGNSIAEQCAPSGLNNAMRAMVGIFLRAVGYQGADIASASTTSIAASNTGLFQKITGSTTITSFGTVRAGTFRIIEFTGSLTLTHNAIAMILPGAASLVTRAGDVAFMISLGSGNWKCLKYTRSAGLPAEELLSVQTASSSATIDFVLTDYLAQFRAFKVVFDGVRPATDGVNFQIRTDSNGGASFDAGASAYVHSSIGRSQGGTSLTGESVGAAQIQLNPSGALALIGNSAPENISGHVVIQNANSSTFRTSVNWQTTQYDGDTTFVSVTGGGARAAAQVDDAIRFMFSSGNIAVGNFALYGVR